MIRYRSAALYLTTILAGFSLGGCGKKEAEATPPPQYLVGRVKHEVKHESGDRWADYAFILQTPKSLKVITGERAADKINLSALINEGDSVKIILLQSQHLEQVTFRVFLEQLVEINGLQVSDQNF